MLTTFEEIINRVLKYEGGYVNDPLDPGGETKYGISKRAYPDTDIKNLTKVKAKEIYFKDYWQKSKAAQLPEELRHLYLDTAINIGISRAISILQESIGEITVDGILGNQTLSNAHKTNVYKYALYRLKFYISIVSQKQSQVKYLKGWTNRVMDIIT